MNDLYEAGGIMPTIDGKTMILAGVCKFFCNGVCTKVGADFGLANIAHTQTGQYIHISPLIFVSKAVGTEAEVYPAEASNKNDLLKKILPATVDDYIELVRANNIFGTNHRFTCRQLLLLHAMFDFSDTSYRKVALSFLQKLTSKPPKHEGDNEMNIGFNNLTSSTSVNQSLFSIVVLRFYLLEFVTIGFSATTRSLYAIQHTMASSTHRL
ncbi:unnamed protein product [Vicia faba]|uniref:Uncharacterized protein n=1 Tax=Vicia faba TaxID=3906 RepID=A0AAV0ZQN6_VICFA|nr:unnamed protein product [Vicia faba]